MTDLTHFERQEEEVGPFSSYEEKFAWACGYNTCLEQTNAKELYEALQGLMREAEHNYPTLTKSGVWPQYEKAKAALSKATEKPQP